MATLVTFHAHPDDESIATGGVMIDAAQRGHRVVLVVGTRGEQGEPVDGVLDKGENLWERRVQETHRAASILGADRVEFLGYEDSGMMGEPTNDNPNCFWQADVEEAAEKLAALLREVEADVFTVYDDHGGYGHPDHIQVHRVGMRAAELAGVPHVFQSTMNRDRMRAMMQTQREVAEAELDAEVEADLRERLERNGPEMDTFGSLEADITHAIDVTTHAEKKREAMRAHASQISDESFFLKMPDDVFAAAFGIEWFIKAGEPREVDAPFGTDLFDGLG